MDKQSKIFVAGSNGLVGSALVRRLQAGGYENLLLPKINGLDLTCRNQTVNVFGNSRFMLPGSFLPPCANHPYHS